MNSEELEGSLRYLWSKSQVPFNRENLVAHTGLTDKKLDKALISLVKDGILRVDGSGGEMQWSFHGIGRPIEGPETLERFERLEKMRAEVKAKVKADALARRRQAAKPLADSATSKSSFSRQPRVRDGNHSEDGDASILGIASGAAKGTLALVSGAAGKLDRKSSGGKKSLIASAGLSLLGPLGWFYAGSFREAVPATLLYMLIAWLIPNPILWPLLWVILPASAAAGFFYALQYNLAGERKTLLLKELLKEPNDG